MRQQGTDIPGRRSDLQKGFLGAKEVYMRNMKQFGSTLGNLSEGGLKLTPKLHIMRGKWCRWVRRNKNNTQLCKNKQK